MEVAYTGKIESRGVVMDYREKLYAVVDKYFMEVVIPYSQTNKDAWALAKKLKLFSKKNYDRHIEQFQGHLTGAEELTMEGILWPAEDEAACKMAEAFYQSQKTFVRLCGRCIDFFQLQNRFARHEKVTIDDIKEGSLLVQLSSNSAMRDIDALENAYKAMKIGANPPEEENQ